MALLKKMTTHQKNSESLGFIDMFWASAGAFVSIALLEYVNLVSLAATDQVLLIGSFGASAAIIYGAVKSPLGRLRNFVGGHLLSAFIGVTVMQIFPDIIWLAGGIAVAGSVAVMCMTRLFHPPGSATALIAVIGSGDIHAMGYSYILIPVSFCVGVMFVLAFVVRKAHRLHHRVSTKNTDLKN